jgi:RNA polymerase sigma factor (TIGR02999 family)
MVRNRSIRLILPEPARPAQRLSLRSLRDAAVCNLATVEAQPQSPEASRDLTRLMQDVRSDQGTAEELLALVYGELRRLAAAKMAREAPGQTLQPTALVHEAWLRLGADRQPVWKNRAHFFSAAAEAMRRILIENARRRRRVRHGGRLERVDAEEVAVALASPEPDDQVLVVHESLDALEAQDARAAEIVKQWYFVGLTLEEIAQLYEISVTTVKRDLAYARTWLFNEAKRMGGAER